MKIYTVYFINDSRGICRIIGKGRNYKQANKIIHKFLNFKNYKSHYWRTWRPDYDDTTWIDVGSWSEIFCIKKEVI